MSFLFYCTLKIILNQPQASLASLCSSYYLRSLQNSSGLFSSEANLYFILTPHIPLRPRELTGLNDTSQWTNTHSLWIISVWPSVQLCGGCKERGLQKAPHPSVEMEWLLGNRDKGQKSTRQPRERERKQPMLFHIYNCFIWWQKTLTFFLLYIFQLFWFLYRVTFHANFYICTLLIK